MKDAKHIMLVALWFFMHVTCPAQRNKIDSLKRVLPALEDSARIDCLNSLSNIYNIINTDTAFFFAMQALKMSEKIGYVSGIGEAYNNMAWVKYRLMDNLPEMETYCQRGISVLQQNVKRETLANSFFLLGVALQFQGKFSEAIDAYTKAAQNFEASGKELDVAGMYACMAWVEENRGQYAQSLTYSVKWLRVAKKYNSKRYLDIWGDLYRNIGDYETAMEYYRQAAQYALQTERIDELASFTQQMGQIYFLQKKYDSARWFYEQAQKYMAVPFQLNMELGELFFGLRDYDSSKLYLNKARSHFTKSNARQLLLGVLLCQSKTYKATGELSKAMEAGTQLLKTATETGARQYARDAHLVLYQLFVLLNKQSAAFSHLKEYTWLKDTIDRDLSAQHLAYYKIRSEKEKDQFSVNLLKEEKKLQLQKLLQTEELKNLLIAGIVAVFVIGSVIIRIIVVQRRHIKQRLEHKLDIQKLENEKANVALQQQATELEMQALRTQMNPHFIFNSLNSINRFILQNNKLQASDYLTKFSKLVRLILQNSQVPLITLQSELEALELYLELEALRFDNQFESKIKIDGDIESTIIKVPPLIIQPYAENAIWHGLIHKENKGHLTINIYQEEDDILCCKITDDGIGRKRAAELKSKSASAHKSMGMQITADRIAMMHKQSNHDSSIKINDLILPDGSAGGTEVIITIPIQYDE
ncbi:hypothetical protein BH20BAC1_BH20BAC1_07550 [soil metagenome]